ncbi:rhodanese-like domain-containing protein [Bremerella cremea]|uniref:Rhodanese-like domain-containing protein n=1 Tax=Bremerella cremea TaxID=1031537 RepID=A0A368KUF1_9BACT|nr:rhodanese-like domain-containing protein [Bremerella cremea]RCS50520.1 rhodanese-like domain-containing protein [Bremerella cremea]
MINPTYSFALSLLAVFALVSPALAVDLKEVQKQVEEGKAVLIDVREEDEWKREHLAHAILVPGSEINSRENRDKALEKIKADPDQKIYCHCKSGGRAKLAARVLGKLGIEVIPITESYREMVDAGFVQATEDGMQVKPREKLTPQ